MVSARKYLLTPEESSCVETNDCKMARRGASFRWAKGDRVGISLRAAAAQKAAVACGGRRVVRWILWSWTPNNPRLVENGTIACLATTTMTESALD